MKKTIQIGSYKINYIYLRFGLVRFPLLLDEDEDEELLETELDPDEEELEECEDESLDELLAEELRLLSLLLETEPSCFFFSLPRSFFFSLSASDARRIFALHNKNV